ncbi:hypothetical protein NDU88_002044 [Pleurodeles waltl]|uniref:Uncharacterized protein n=1 Tax=Pleurodeles waltl TaxID=8319 RepID=A0AAV7W297_PLEWA|nr:hypothetical protein NDU88_002044 [Pleurodeles waltl]
MTHGVPRPLTAIPQVIPPGGPPAASPSRFPGAPPGFDSMHLGRPRRNQGCTRSIGSKEQRPLGRVPTRDPSPCQVLRVPQSSKGRPRRCRRRTWAAHSALVAARLPTRGRSFK